MFEIIIQHLENNFCSVFGPWWNYNLMEFPCLQGSTAGFFFQNVIHQNFIHVIIFYIAQIWNYGAVHFAEKFSKIYHHEFFTYSRTPEKYYQTLFWNNLNVSDSIRHNASATEDSLPNSSYKDVIISWISTESPAGNISGGKIFSIREAVIITPSGRQSAINVMFSMYFKITSFTGSP